MHDPIQVGLRNLLEGTAFGQILADQAVGVFVGPAFPGRIRMGKVDRHLQLARHRAAFFIRAVPGATLFLTGQMRLQGPAGDLILEDMLVDPFMADGGLPLAGEPASDLLRTPVPLEFFLDVGPLGVGDGARGSLLTALGGGGIGATRIIPLWTPIALHFPANGASAPSDHPGDGAVRIVLVP